MTGAGWWSPASVGARCPSSGRWKGCKPFTATGYSCTSSSSSAPDSRTPGRSAPLAGRDPHFLPTVTWGPSCRRLAGSDRAQLRARACPQLLSAGSRSTSATQAPVSRGSSPRTRQALGGSPSRALAASARHSPSAKVDLPKAPLAVPRRPPIAPGLRRPPLEHRAGVPGPVRGGVAAREAGLELRQRLGPASRPCHEGRQQGVPAARSELRMSPNRIPTEPPRPASARLAKPPGEFKMPPGAPLYHPLPRPGNAVYGVNSYRGFESLSLRSLVRLSIPMLSA